MNKRSKIILISVLSVILGVVCLLTGKSLIKPVVPVRGEGPTPVPTVVAYDPTKAEGTEANPFTILEIVPNYSYAQIGYLIDGQEPVNVYGIGGILENARAGYEGAYDYLEMLSEFTVTGPKGGLTGVGDGTGGGSRTIYAFDDEKGSFTEVPAGAVWTRSDYEIERVTGYYTVATQVQKDNDALTKYKLVKVNTTNQNDTSGIDGRVYTTNELSGFRYKSSYWETGEYERTDWVWPNTDNIYDYNHYLEPGTIGENLKRYKRKVDSIYRPEWNRDVYYYTYSRDDSGDYIYYTEDGHMYYQQYNGSYVGVYTAGYCVYQMVEETGSINSSETYYIYNNTPLSFENNQSYINGAFDLGNSIWIEGEAYDYVEITDEYYYTYTLREAAEEGAEEYVFKDEMVPGVEYKEEPEGKTDRAGSYVVVDADIRANSAIKKYEYVHMLKSEAERALDYSDWINLGWIGSEEDRNKLLRFREATNAEKTNPGIQKYDMPNGFVLAVDYDSTKDKGSNGLRYERLDEADKISDSETPENLKRYRKVPAGWEFVAKEEGWTGDTYDYDVTYSPAASYSNKKYTTDIRDTSKLYFVTFSTEENGVKKYNAFGEKSNKNDNNNNYFYKKKDGIYTLINNSYTGSYRGGNGSDTSDYRLVLFNQNNRGTYYVKNAVPYSETGNYGINQKISSMLYTKTEDTSTYVQAFGTSGRFIRVEKEEYYVPDADGDYIYYKNSDSSKGYLYKEADADETEVYVLYDTEAGCDSAENYLYFDNDFYRKNESGNYVAEYGYHYGNWLRPVTQTYVSDESNVGKTFYYWKGLSYADNLKYHSDATYKAKVKEDANWDLVETKEESYFAKKPAEPGITATPTPPEEVIPTERVTITHSNVFLKNVMNLAYQDNNPTKQLDIDLFEFGGWYTEKECINKYDFENSAFRSNSTLYAKWIPKTSDDNVFESNQYYTVKFFAKADATEPGYTLEYFKGELNLSKVSYIPTKAASATEKYAFLGWSTKKNGAEGDVLTDVSRTAATISLYPVWKTLTEKDIYTVNFNVTKAGGAETEVVKTLKVYENGHIKTVDGAAVSDKYMKSMASFEPASQTGKKFVGWYAEENPEFPKDVPYNFEAPLKGDVELYACWIEEDVSDETMFTITYNGNEASVESLLLDKDNQKVEDDSFYSEIKYFAFKADGTFAAAAKNTTPRLKGNVQYKASQYKIEVKTMLPSDLNRLSNKALNSLLDKADMIVVSNSNDTNYDAIFADYAVKEGGAASYTGSNDLKYSVATAIFKKSMEAGSAPIMLDKTLLDFRDEEATAKLNIYKLFVMLQAMDASMFYDSFMKAGLINVSTSELWTRVDANGKYGTSERWYCENFISALGLSDEELGYYGIDENYRQSAYETIFLKSENYPTSLTNHCYVYSGDVFKYGTEFTNNEIAQDEFYTANLFDYFNGKKDKYAPADAVNYMVFGYQPEVGLDETTAILELQPEHTFKDFKFWYLFVKKYIPNYSGKLIVDCKNTQKTIYLGNAVDDNCETLTVRQMGSLEFVGLISDLNSDYRMIYFGGDLSRDNADEMQIDGNYYAYLHTGNTRTNLYEKVLGVLGGDTDTLNISCYPGNDITAVKMRELYEYCAVANSPIIIDDSLFYNVVENKINTDLMDSSSNLYQLFTNDTNGLLGTAPCYAESNVDYDTMSALMNEDRVRLLVSSVPPTYKEGQGDSLNYLNPQNQESRILEYKFVLQGKQNTKYKVRLFIDMNADGQFNRATEMLDSLVIRTGRTILSNRATLEAGKEYTVQRSISDYVGVMPWKLEVYEVDNESVRHSVTGMTAIKPVKKNDEGTGFVKEKLNILQVTSAKGGLNKYGENNAYMPTTKEMEDLDALGADYKGKKYSQLEYWQQQDVRNKLPNVPGDANKQVAYDFWVYLSSLKEFDISITRVSLSELAEGISSGHLEDQGIDFKMDNFNMLIMGFADCYNEITDEASLVAVEDFIESGKSVLFTHDCSSFFNYSEKRAVNDSFYTGNSGISYWGYNINKRFRNMLGMDRYGVTLMYGNETVQETGFDFTNNVIKATGTKYKLHTTSLMGTLSETGFVAGAAYEEIAQEMAKKDVLYKYNENQEKIWMNNSENKAYVQGYTRLLLKDNDNGVEGYTSTKVSNVNAGQITRYPFTIPDNFSVASTHSQYYQLDLEANDIVVWYCLADNSGVFNQFYNDARNNYYIYSKGNIMYTGVGHSGGLSENEIKLFINTMVAAYAASADPTAPKIINFDRTTGADEIDYLYVDYDTTFPELAIGEGVDGDKDGEGKPLPNNQTKEINFKLTENSIVTNKLMTVYVYEYVSKNGDGSYNYEPLPMEMQVQKYNSDDSTSPVEGIPVFVVNTDLANTGNPEYTYSKGQVLSIDSNVMVQAGSITGTSVTIGGITYPLTPSGNGYYYDYNNSGSWDEGDAISYKALSKLDDKGLPVYSSSDVISGYIYIAPIVDAGEEYVFKAPIGALMDKDMVPYKLHVNLRYGKRQDKTKDGFKELSVVRRGLFNLD